MKRTPLFIIVLMLLFIGCSRKQDRSAKKEEPPAPLPLSQLPDYSDTEVFPLVNGNAYLVSGIYQKQLFLLSREKASLIEGVNLKGFDTPIYPLPDGAAYLLSSENGKLRLYYLLGDKASLVREEPIKDAAVMRKPAFPEAFLWTQMQAVLARYRRARAQAEDTSEPMSEPDAP